MKCNLKHIKIYYEYTGKKKKKLTSEQSVAVAAQKKRKEKQGQQGAVFQIFCINKTSTDPQVIKNQVSVFISVIMLMLHMPQPIVSSGVKSRYIES